MSLRRYIVSLCCLSGMVASPAQAWVRSAVSQTPNPLSQCVDSSGAMSGLVYVYWNTRTHPWRLYQDPASTSTVAGLDWNGVQQTLQAATQTWNDVSCSDLNFQYGGPTTQFTVGYDPNSKDNENVEMFRTSACSDPTVVPTTNACLTNDSCGDTFNCWGHEDDIIALTTTTFDSNTGELFDSDTEFNATINPMDGEPYYHFTDYADTTLPACEDPRDPTQTNCIATDVQNTATHEFGHYLGLGHSLDTMATMFAYAPPGQTTKRVLSQDDIEVICLVYPKGKPPDSCVPVPKKTGCAAAGADGFALLALGWAMKRRQLQRQKL